MSVLINTKSISNPLTTIITKRKILKKCENFEHNGLTNITRKEHHQFHKFHIFMETQFGKTEVDSKMQVKFATLSKMVKPQ